MYMIFFLNIYIYIYTYISILYIYIYIYIYICCTVGKSPFLSSFQSHPRTSSRLAEMGHVNLCPLFASGHLSS